MEKSIFELPDTNENTYFDTITQSSDKYVKGETHLITKDEKDPYSVVFRIVSCAGTINQKVTYTNYTLENENELHSYESSVDSKIMFDFDRIPFIFDDYGIVNLETKELLLQYHIHDQDLALYILKHGIDWNSRFSNPSKSLEPSMAGRFLILG